MEKKRRKSCILYLMPAMVLLAAVFFIASGFLMREYKEVCFLYIHVLFSIYISYDRK